MDALKSLPVEFQQDWGATLQRNVGQQAKGHFYLTNIRRSAPKDWQSERITVQVVDENGFPMANVRVAFAYSTAEFYPLTQDFLWVPGVSPQRAFIVPTDGSGTIDQIQGGVIRDGQPGGVTVYLLEPEYSSDIVTGMGMLANHTGIILTFQLQRVGVSSLASRLDALESRVSILEG
jgi:hypothetical protein